MLPWKTIIKTDKSSEVPVYLQVVNAVIRETRNGIIKPGHKMPGTRTLSETLELHRQTVVKAYDELYAQGWLVLVPSKGTFVSEHLPEVKPKKLVEEGVPLTHAEKTGYNFRINNVIHSPAQPNRHITGFHDGPDVRLVPGNLLSRGYKSILTRKSGLFLLSYIDVEGRQTVRKAIADYLNSTRGLQTSYENIMVTRGAQMAMFMLASILISKGDLVITGDISFRYADLTFMHAGAKLVRVKVDEEGIDADEIEKLCMRKKIRALYITSHHHYPTTVTLSASRRMKIIHLAEKYKFIIIEDDYDYEFHYESSPILPLASVDRHGMVVYIGSFSKTITPTVRMGYVAAPPNLVQEMAKLRQLIDAQGDPVMEEVVAELLNEGEIRRHMKKAIKIYKERRDFMCKNLKEKFGDIIDFKVPEGGLAIWAQFNKKVQVSELSARLLKNQVALSPGRLHDITSGRKLNSTRMGFGWMNLNEAEKAINIMEKVIRKEI